MKKYGKKIILAIIILAVGAVSYYKFLAPAEQVHYVTVNVGLGNISRTVNATGEVGAAQLVDVGAQVSGQIESLYVKLGQTVKKGDLLAQIDSTTQQNDLDSNKAKLQSYQAQLEKAQVTLKVAKSQYDREKKLLASNATSKENVENAENAHATAKSSVAELESLITQTQIAVNTAEVNLGYTTIIAPLDGTIVALLVEEGQTVNANQTTPNIVQIADLSQMEILLEISEGDITKIEPGMTVTYTVLSEPTRIFETTLYSVDPGLTKLTNGTYSQGSNTSEAVYYYGRLLVPNPEGKLRIGMTTQSSVLIAHAEDVLTVPTMAVHTKGSAKYVNVLEAGHVVAKFVETGLSDNMNIEIISGLNTGDAAVLSQMTSKEVSSSANNTNMRMPRM